MRRLAALVLVALLGACGTGPGRAQVMGDLAQQEYLPSVVGLAEDTDRLAAAIDALCQSPAPDGLDEARELWSTAIAAWGEAQSAGFGPVDDLRLASTIRYAVDADKVESLAAQEPTADEVAAAGADARGLDAIGVLLTGEGAADLTTEQGVGRCGYAAAVADQVSAAAAEVAAGWEEDHAARLAEEEGAQMNLEEGFNAMTQAVAEADRALLSLLAEEEGMGSETIRRLVAGAAAVYLPSDEGARLADLVGDAEVRDDLVERFSSAIDYLDGIPAHPTPAELQQAHAEVGEVLRGLQSSLAGQLGVTLMLSDADGDA